MAGQTDGDGRVSNAIHTGGSCHSKPALTAAARSSSPARDSPGAALFLAAKCVYCLCVLCTVLFSPLLLKSVRNYCQKLTTVKFEANDLVWQTFCYFLAS
jgi:hypothetical protein